jgi:hypothetical protein
MPLRKPAHHRWSIKSASCNVIIPTDEEPACRTAPDQGLECGNANLRYQRVAVGTPQLGVLRQPVDQHAGPRSTVQLINAEPGAERHEAPNEIGPLMSVLAKNP